MKSNYSQRFKGQVQSYRDKTEIVGKDVPFSEIRTETVQSGVKFKRKLYILQIRFLIFSFF